MILAKIYNFTHFVLFIVDSQSSSLRSTKNSRPHSNSYNKCLEVAGGTQKRRKYNLISNFFIGTSFGEGTLDKDIDRVTGFVSVKNTNMMNSKKL